MKRKTATVAATSIIAAIFLIAGIACWLTFRTDATTDHLTLRWHASGKPMWVEGVVLSSQQTPLKGQPVHVVDDSGGQFATTDENGRFAVCLGEAKAIGLELDGYGEMKWEIVGFGGLDVTKGIELTITVRP